jgi:dipeptidyl aminopeptidase/acylaminoacyl peptidase
MTGTKEEVSHSPLPSSNTAMSGGPSISADGRFVAFHSDKNDLVEDDTNATTDVFVRDRETDELVRILAPDGEPFDRPAAMPEISGDGNVVVFVMGWYGAGDSSAQDLRLGPQHQHDAADQPDGGRTGGQRTQRHGQGVGRRQLGRIRVQRPESANPEIWRAGTGTPTPWRCSKSAKVSLRPILRTGARAPRIRVALRRPLPGLARGSRFARLCLLS